MFSFFSSFFFLFLLHSSNWSFENLNRKTGIGEKTQTHLFNDARSTHRHPLGHFSHSFPIPFSSFSRILEFSSFSFANLFTFLCKSLPFQNSIPFLMIQNLNQCKNKSITSLNADTHIRKTNPNKHRTQVAHLLRACVYLIWKLNF